MFGTIPPKVADESPEDIRSRRGPARGLGRAIEAGVLALVCLAPWAFGARAPKYVFFLDIGVAALTILWGTRALLQGQLTLRKCPVAACIIALILVGSCQVVPLSDGLLSRVSPATARMYDRLLPARPEVTPAGDPIEAPIRRPGSTISIDPGSTRRELAGLLALLLLFTIARNNIDPAAGLRHLAIAATANGALLALFGLVQFFSADVQTVYWVYPTAGSPFGPFTNRNHFAFYMNVCVGLGVGLLLGRVAGHGGVNAGRTRRGGDDLAARASRGAGGGIMWTRQASILLSDPAAQGMTFALGLMISSVALCQSRGGFVALLGGLLVGLVLWRTQPRRSGGGEAVVLALAVSMALVCWFGYEQVATRLNTLRDGEALRDRRLAIWARALPLVRDFPLWGTGYGTYEFVDMLHRADAVDAGMIADHAHNDYLEMLVEGGLAQLIPGVLAGVLVSRLGLRAVRRLGGSPTGTLAIGALAAFSSVLIHSASDFGMHIPSCAALVAVLCALLCGLGSEAGESGPVPSSDPGSDGRDPGRFRFSGLSSVLGVVTVLAMGLVVVREGWRAYQSQNLRIEASDLDYSGDPTRLERKAALLEAAARLAPEDARLEAEVAHAQLNIFEQRIYEMDPDSADAEMDRDSADAASVPPAPAPPPRVLDAAAVGKLRRDRLVPALRHLLRSRDLSPLRAEAHMEIAEHVGDLASSDPRESYLSRAKRLAPADPDLWYRCGLLELEHGRADQAWASWRRSLELSEAQLPAILERSAGHLDPAALVRHLLPDRPDLLLKAALQLHPQPGEGRRPFLEKALAILAAGRASPPGAADLYLKAKIHLALGQPAEALTAYRAALDLEPMQLTWRYELAETSYAQGQFQESFQELLKVLMLQPDNTPARELMDAVRRKIAEGGEPAPD